MFFPEGQIRVHLYGLPCDMRKSFTGLHALTKQGFYTYLVDVLQRVGQNPAARVAELTPLQGKPNFAANPLRSDLHTLSA